MGSVSDRPVDMQDGGPALPDLTQLSLSDLTGALPWAIRAQIDRVVSEVAADEPPIAAFGSTAGTLTGGRARE
jgi:hypothetical protein